MSDLISRKALLDTLNRGKIPYNADVNYFILQAPAVDAEPVRHGKRTVYTIWHSPAWGEIHTKFECCGFDVRGVVEYNYCPICGARRDAEG